MPNTAPITINDGTSDITFSPDSASSTHVVLQNQAVSVIAERELLHFDRSAQEGTQVRRSIRLNMPYVETDANGAEATKFISVKMEMVAPKTSSVTNRVRAKTIAEGAFASSQADAVFTVPEWFW